MTKILSVLLCAAVVIGLLPTGSCKKTTTVIDTVPPLGDTTNRHINDSIWAYYPLNGNLGDSSGNNHQLTLNGSGAILGYDQWGNSQGALDFNGGSSYAEIADGANFTSQNFTVSLFSMWRQTKGMIFSKVNYNDATGPTFNLSVDPHNFLDTINYSISTLGSNICSTPANGGQDMRDPTQAIQVDSWYHTVISFANGVMKLYVNGVLVHTEMFSSTQLIYCPSAPFIIGNWWSLDNGPAMDGKIDEIRIYSRALKDNEVAYLFKTFMTR